MIRFVAPYITIDDVRGSMTGLLDFGEWREANLFRSEAGCVRGAHFHRHTTEAFVMLQGAVRITVQHVVEDQLSGDVEIVHAKAGDVFIIQPNVCHTFEILESCSWINLLDAKMSNSTPDLFRPRIAQK